MPGDVEALLAILRSHARSLEGDDPGQALRCGAVGGYVGNDHRAIANYRTVPLASSGAMEKGDDITIRARPDTRGHELVPPRRQPPAAAQAAAPRWYLGPLTGPSG